MGWTGAGGVARTPCSSLASLAPVDLARRGGKPSHGESQKMIAASERAKPVRDCYVTVQG